MIRPLVSTTVVIKGADITAGSTPHRLAAIGKIAPMKELMVTMAIKVAETVSPI